MVKSSQPATSVMTDELSYIRKIRKPMVEKQRRDRINSSIEQLKLLIANTIKQNTAPMTRVDKADILELTVYHLTQLHQQPQSVTMATEAAAFHDGYSACAKEAVTCLSNSGITNSEMTSSLSLHLNRKAPYQCGNPPVNSRLTALKSEPYAARRSTPLRQDTACNIDSPTEMVYSDFSPIQNDNTALPELTSSFVRGALNTSSSVNFPKASYSIDSDSSGYSSESVSNTSHELSSPPQSTKRNMCADVVTIGNGKEDEIGHVIKEVIWRPF